MRNVRMETISLLEIHNSYIHIVELKWINYEQLDNWGMKGQARNKKRMWNLTGGQLLKELDASRLLGCELEWSGSVQSPMMDILGDAN
jgi:hypothetical protein